MRHRININSSSGAYLMDIVNKLTMPMHRNEDKLRQDDIEYYRKRNELLETIEVDSYEQFIKNRISLRITPFMIERQLANMTQLVFEVTENCNLKCKYCGYGEFYGDYDERTDAYMSFEIAKAIVDFLVPYWESEQHVSFKKELDIAFYGGEPLMNMKFIKVMWSKIVGDF